MKWSTGSKTAIDGQTLSLLVLLLVSQCAAQATSAQTTPTSAAAANTQTTTAGAAPSTQTPATTAQTDGTSQSATTSDLLTTTSDAKTTNTGSASVSLLLESSTSSSSSSESSSSSDSAETGSTSIFHYSNLPSIAGATVPTQVVPNTANAPYMQKSNMPEGSVFIIVGAILGFFGASVLAWRGLVALSLKRSVKRAALAQQQTFDLKSGAYPPPSAGVYGIAPPGSAVSMEKLAPVPKTNKPGGRHRPSTSQSGLPAAYNPAVRQSTQNLFFSPTAGAGLHSHSPSPMHSQRPASNYLPAGYYAAGSSQPAGGAGTTHINAHAMNTTPTNNTYRGSSMLNPLTDRLSGLRAEHAGYQRTGSLGPSPPDSPALSPSPNAFYRPVRTDSPGAMSSVVGQVGASGSASTLNLNAPGGTTQAGGRAPSAYLEDLFENHGSGPRERF